MDLLDKRNVPVESLGGLVYAGQKEHNPDIELDECIDAVYHVLHKREIQNILLLGINVDMWVDRGIEDRYLAEILKHDEGQFQCDETLSHGCVEIFGGIGISNLGYLDHVKPGIIGKVDARKNSCNVFLDDILAGIVASAEAYVANKHPMGVYREFEEEK